MSKSIVLKIILSLCALLAFVSCATYYERMMNYQENVESGDFAKANSALDNNKKLRQDRNEVLYHLNKGYTYRMMGEYENSIAEFHEAENMIEDYTKNIGAEVVSLISNPMVKPYRVEDYENIMVNYYQAFNYLAIGKHEDAIVECKRINNKLNQLNDKYKAGANRYKNDAFAHNLMGIIYESDYDYNNAFIAYRNAYEAYVSDGEILGVSVPEQLKQDLMRSAYLAGFGSDLNYYERLFQTTYYHSTNPNGEVVVFWENGFAPVKDELSINFVTSASGGTFVLENADLGLAFNYRVPMADCGRLSSLNILRVAFPKLVNREAVYKNAEIQVNGNKYPLQLAENVNEIAFKTLHDRMMRELGNSLLRLAMKKAVEITAEQQNEYVGLALAIANAATEKADTRYWQTLPNSISYSRIPLSDGNNELKLIARKGDGSSRITSIDVRGEKGKTIFQTITNPASYPAR